MRVLPKAVPVSVSVRGPLPDKTTAVLVLNVSGPDPDPSMLPPLVVRRKCRSVLVAGPVYCSVPPPRTRLIDKFEDAPMLLLAPPSASKLTLRMPPAIAVAPV